MIRAQTEDFYQLNLENHYKCSHVKCFYGVTDITTDDSHIEIKRWSIWKSAFGQLLAYQMTLKRTHLKLYLFGRRPRISVVEQMVKHLNTFGVTLFHLDYDEQNDIIRVIDVRDEEVSEYVTCVSTCLVNAYPEYNSFEKFKAYYDSIPNDQPSSFIVDLDEVYKWLNSTKKNIMKTLKLSFVQNTDYILNKSVKPVKRTVKSNNVKTVLLTQSCFKQLCMKSHSKGSDIVRSYLAQV